MSTTQRTDTNARTIVRRLAAGATLAVAPLLIALGAATVAHADTGTTATDNGGFNAPAPHHIQRNHDIQRGYLPHTSISRHSQRHYAY